MSDEDALPKRPSGPIDLAPWSRTLPLGVVDTRGPRRIQGYAVEADLARHYGFEETLFLSLQGRLPTAEERKRLNSALVLLAPVSAADGPGRAAVLTRLMSGKVRASLQSGWLTLVEHADEVLARYAALLTWLKSGAMGRAPHVDDPTSHPLPDIAYWQRLCPTARPGMSSTAVALCLLHSIELASESALVLLVCMSGIATVAAEAEFANTMGAMAHPIDLPTTVLIGGDDD